MKNSLKMILLLATLLAQGLEVAACCGSCDKQIIAAVEHGNLAEAQRLLGKNPSPDAQEKKGGHSLLQMAITQRSLQAPTNAVEMVELLLKAGANPNLQSNAGNTPLIYAVKYAYKHKREDAVKIIQLLLANGADLSIANNKGETAATYAKNLSEIAEEINGLLK